VNKNILKKKMDEKPKRTRKPKEPPRPPEVPQPSEEPKVDWTGIVKTSREMEQKKRTDRFQSFRII